MHPVLLQKIYAGAHLRQEQAVDVCHWMTQERSEL